ncbi:hypothetical protein RJ639_001298 [Escallonia herrerae]|uniref:Bifunctional inhibitor/plant lipid transfer protein/seed storage helical domain-containing protein n=1 Tax=Escallonia herrerae TaxID=1293975 RepID=A0AA89BIB3_9ASTE|nr:hypothetical protein RJ639_001298 [Escallonia herrerae]
MASSGINIGIALVLITMLLAGAKAQSGCTNVLISMAPCLNYVTGSSLIPSSSCCSSLASVVQSQPQCLCSALSGGSSALGININQTLALALPGACNVQTPPISKCDAANGPAATPSASPESSPPESSVENPDSPTSSSSGSGAGARDGPRAGARTRDGPGAGAGARDGPGAKASNMGRTGADLTGTWLAGFFSLWVLGSTSGAPLGKTTEKDRRILRRISRDAKLAARGCPCRGYCAEKFRMSL